MSFITYTTGVWIGLFAVFGLSEGGVWGFLFPLISFGVIPLLELFITPNENNLSQKDLKKRKESPVFQWILYLVLPLQYLLVYMYLEMVSRDALSWIDWTGATLTLGVACGVYGINVAHELGHRVEERSRFISKALLLTTLYMHFFIEHNRGHHSKVATPEDPSSARLGESLYHFWIRSISGAFKSAWSLEATRLSRRDIGAWTFKNQMLRFICVEVIFLALIGLKWGLFVLFSFIICAILGFLLLESVNYIEHYGLQRAKRERGGYEPVRPIHSWNSNHPLGRLVLFELSRHSDHHAHPTRPYATLRHHEHSLQLPTGYPGMILFSLIPPLFIPYMNRYIQRENERLNKQSPLMLNV